jgi:hypothetical protein
MRVAGPLLTLSALLIAAPALAQGGYYDPGAPYDWDWFDRYEYYPPPQGQMWRGPIYHGPMRRGPWRDYSEQSGAQRQQGPSGGSTSQQMGAAETGQLGSSAPGPVTFATQSQIKSSLESNGFKNVTVVPQSFLIRATAPDGSRILMQVSSDSLAGIVVNPSNQGSAGGTAGSPGTGKTGGNTGAANSTGGTSNTGGAGGAGAASNTGSSGSGAASNTEDTGGTGTSGGSGTGSTPSGNASR